MENTCTLECTYDTHTFFIRQDPLYLNKHEHILYKAMQEFQSYRIKNPTEHLPRYANNWFFTINLVVGICQKFKDSISSAQISKLNV